MTTLAELVAAEPEATRGHPTQIEHGDGVWRAVLELADPSAGVDVEWYDITDYCAGYETTRGADQAFGRYRAQSATIHLYADDDTLAPWNPDTSPTFGTHVQLGPGLLIRFGLIRVVEATVVEWNPRFTLRVAQWDDACYARGRIRLHEVGARDTLTSLVNVPIGGSVEENWSERLDHVLTQAEWAYDVDVYGATFATGPADIKTLPARGAQTSAIAELDATLDPVGLVAYTDRTGKLIVRPLPWDTFHADAFTAGAAGTPWVTPSPCMFSNLAEDDPSGDLAAYAVDITDPFGLGTDEMNVINHVVRTDGATFDDDDPTSIERFERKTDRKAWIAENDQVAQDLLDNRAWTQYVARPISCHVDMHGFHPGPANVDFLQGTSMSHQTAPGRLFVDASGALRQYTETIGPRGGESSAESIEWDMRIVFDVYATGLESGASLLPVEDLALTDVDDTTAEFSWTNPSQVVTPTHTQVRLLNPTSLWSTFPYPITGFVWHGLDPDTHYEFQVRLIRTVSGIITHFSPSRSYEFDTTWTIPIVDIDEDGDGDVTFPDPPCGSLDWELQESEDGDDWSTVIDSGTISSPPWTVDLSGYTFDPTKLYRIWQDACGDETYSDIFTGACTDPPALADPPFDDADLVAYWPGICPPDIVNEAITESPALHGPNFGLFVLDGDLNVVLVSEGEGVIVLGATPGTPVPGDSDITLACKVLITTQPDAPIALFAYEDISLDAVAEGANWAVQSRVSEDGAGITTVTDGDELDYGTWIDLAVTHDVAAGDLRVYIDAVEAVTALGTVGARTNGGTFLIGGPDGTLITNCAVWDRVLDPEELPGHVAGPTVTINQGASQEDPTIDTSIVFDVVFSEAVSGFATGDVTLSGTAGATTGTVSGSGTTYTVTVTGMTGAGTVIASIAAAVCTSVATSLPNLASTSSDNTVTFGSDPLTILGSKLEAWWDFTDIASYNILGALPDDPSGTPAMFDKTANAHDLNVVGGPVVTANQINGLPACVFDGANTYFSSNTTFVFALGTPEIWAVVRSDASATGSIVSEGVSGGNNPNLRFPFDDATNDQYVLRLTNNSGTIRYDNQVARSATGSWDLFIGTDNGAATGTNAEAVDVDTNSTGSYTRDGSGWNRLGVGANRRSTISAIFEGAMADILILDSPASSGERTALTAYFNAKFGQTWTPT